MDFTLHRAHEKEPMVTALLEANKTSVAEAGKKRKVSEPTIYTLRTHLGQMEAADVNRLKTLEIENSRPRKLLAKRDLNVEVLKEINAEKW